MTPSARLALALSLSAAIAASDRGGDRMLRTAFRARRYMGAKDRRAVGDLVYGVIRAWYRLDWLAARHHLSDDLRARGLAFLAGVRGLPRDQAAIWFDGGRHGLAPLTDREQALWQAIADSRQAPVPAWVRDESPLWLDAALDRSLGAARAREMAALAAPAPVDLRVNPARLSRPALIAALARDGIAARPTPFSPWGVRLDAGRPLTDHPLFKDGSFVFQDEGSQLVAALTSAGGARRIIDCCAGAGGKTLALAAAGDATLIAIDNDPRRLDRLRARAEAAGTRAIAIRALDPTAAVPPDLAGTGDRVLVDAPCSGSGTWRRAPDARLRLTPARLAGYHASQQRLLAAGARMTAPGGRLIYATCTLLRSENEDQIEQFLAGHPDFDLLDGAALWSDALSVPCPVSGPCLRLSPAGTGTDGYFIAVLARAA